MRETSKCHSIRQKRGDFEKYLHGSGIDIGAGWHMDQDVVPLLGRLSVDVAWWGVESWGFNFNAGQFDQTLRDAVAQICFIGRKR